MADRQGTKENPRGTSDARGTNSDRRGTPPEYAPETGSPMFSKGGHGAHDPGPGPLTHGDRDLTHSERKEQDEGQPEPR